MKKKCKGRSKAVQFGGEHYCKYSSGHKGNHKCLCGAMWKNKKGKYVVTKIKEK